MPIKKAAFIARRRHVLTLLLLLLVKLTTAAAVAANFQYEHDIVCNNATNLEVGRRLFNCICYVGAKQTSSSAGGDNYQLCKEFLLEKSVEAAVVRVRGLDIGGTTIAGTPLERIFRRAVANIINGECTADANRCSRTLLDIDEDRVVILEVECADGGMTTVKFTIVNGKQYNFLNDRSVMSGATIATLLRNNEEQLERQLGGVTVVDVDAQRVSNDRRRPNSLKTAGAKGNNLGLTVAIILIGIFFLVVYSIAIFKVCTEYHTRKKRRRLEQKQKLTEAQARAGEEKLLTNSEPKKQPPNYGALEIIHLADDGELNNKMATASPKRPASSTSAVSSTSPDTIVEKGVVVEKSSNDEHQQTPPAVTAAHFDRAFLHGPNYGSVEKLTQHDETNANDNVNRSATIHDFPDNPRKERTVNDDSSSSSDEESLHPHHDDFDVNVNANNAVATVTPIIVIDNQTFLSNLGSYNVLTNSEPDDGLVKQKTMKKELGNGNIVVVKSRDEAEDEQGWEKNGPVVDAERGGSSCSRERLHSSSSGWSASVKGSEDDSSEPPHVGDYSQLAESQLSLDIQSQ